MSLLFAEGWHGYTATTGVSAGVNVNTTGAVATGRYTGTRQITIDGSGSRWVWIQPPAVTGDYLILGLAIKITALPASGSVAFMAINRGATGTDAQSVNTAVRFSVDSSGNLIVLNSNGVQIGSNIANFGNGSWHWLAIKVQALDAGSISVAMDGVLAINAASGDFAQSSATGTSFFVYITDDQLQGGTTIGEVIIYDGS